MGDYLIFVGLGAAATALGMVLIIGRRMWANRHWSSRPKTATNEHNVTVGEPVTMTADEFLELAAHDQAANYGHSLTVTIPGPLEPVDRGERFEVPLDEALEGLGEVVVGGTAMEQRDGRQAITEAAIELSVSDVDAALRIIREILQRQAAPSGTTITQYEPTVIVHNLHDATGAVRDA